MAAKKGPLVFLQPGQISARWKYAANAGTASTCAVILFDGNAHGSSATEIFVCAHPCLSPFSARPYATSGTEAIFPGPSSFGKITFGEHDDWVTSRGFHSALGTFR
jgi:hypothetical protein